MVITSKHELKTHKCHFQPREEIHEMTSLYSVPKIGKRAGHRILSLMIITLIMLCLSVAAFAANDPSNAPILALDITTDAVIDDGGEYAYFSFTPSETRIYDFYSTTSVDTYGYLYDENMNQLSCDDDSGDNNNFKITYELNAGTKYYFGVRFYSNGSGTIPVILSLNPYCTISGYVTNALTGNNIPDVTVQYGSDTTSTDSSGYYTFSLTPSTETITFSKFGFETFQIENLSCSAGQAIVQDVALSPVAATSLTLDTATDALIETAGQDVFFSFTPTETKRYEFYSTGDADTYGYLYDANMVELYTDDDSGENTNFKIAYDLLAGQQYYLRVYNLNSDATGSFPVFVSVSSRGIIKGYVTSEATGEALSEVTVLFNGNSVETDSYGFYQFESDPCADSVHFIKVGYNTLLQNVSCVAGETIQQDAALVKTDITDAPMLTLDTETPAAIDNSGDSAYFSFIPAKSRTYYFQTLNYEDVQAYLFDSNMELLTSSWNGSGFSLEYYLEAGTKYYYGVRYTNCNQTGSFQLMLTYEKRGIIEGHVTDAGTGAPLSGVHVSCNNGYAQGFTDSDGYYQFELPVGTIPVSFDLDGYVDYRIEDVLIEDDVTTTKDAALSIYIPTDASSLTLESTASAGTLDSGNEFFWKYKPAATKTYHFYSVSSTGADLYLYDANMQELATTLYTDDYLTHCICNLTSGNQYYIKIIARGTGSNWVTVSAAQKGTLVGHVYDAGRGAALSDVTVKYGNNITKTDGDGFYWMFAPVGSADLSFTKDNYVNLSYENVDVQLNAVAVKDASLSESLDDDQYRVVLTWGDNPSDLDSHLEGPGYHIWYSNKSASNAWLDVDDTTSYGPETTTFKAVPDRTYTFYVHDFTNGGTPDSTELENSGAVIRIYNGNTQIAERSVPRGVGIYWNVFTLRNGVIRFIDTIGQSRPDSTTDTALVKENQYLISVVDGDGSPLQGATVTFDGETKYSDEYGNALFDAFSFDNPIITVEMDGYFSWTNKNTAWEKSSARFETVVLYPLGVGRLKLSSARYSNNQDMSHSVELLTTTKKVSLGNDAPLTFDLDNGDFYLRCIAGEPSEAASYQLWQGRQMIKESTDGKFALNSDNFAKGGDCFVKVIGKDNTMVDTAINLVFVKEEVNKETVLDLSKNGTSISIGDDIPFLGGSSINLDFPFMVKVTSFISTSDNKIKFGFNLKDDVDSEEEQFKKAKELCEDVRRACGLNVGKLSGAQANTFKSLIKDRNKHSFFSGEAMKDSFEWNVLGYAECDLGGSTATGCIIVQASISPVEFEYNTWCVVVPVTIQVGIDLDGSLTGEISYNFDTSTLDAALSATISPSIKAFGGVGVSKLVGVGAYGSATLDINAEILPKPDFTSVDLTGELGIKAYLAFLTYEKPFAYNTWHLYSGFSTRDGELTDGGDYDFYSQMRLGMYDASLYKRADLGYLKEERDRMGLTGGDDFAARDYGNELGTSFDSLIQNTYRNAQPVTVSSGDAIYAAFLRADADSGHVYTVVSKYDGAGWSSPVVASVNGILDNMPSLLVDGAGQIWLAYAQTSSTYSSDSLLDYAQNQQIVVGSIDPDTLAFTQYNVYSGMGFAHMQELSLVNCVPTLVWVCSETETDNDVLWPEHNSIYQASFTGSAWSGAELVNTVDNVITELTAGQDNGELTVACVADQDNSSASADDKQLLLLTKSEVRAAAENPSSVRFGSIPGTNAEGFIWNDNGVLRSTNGDEVSLSSISGEYYIQGDSIYYVIATDSGAELCVSKYENGSWSQPIVLTEGNGYLENISIAQLNGEDFVLGLYTDITITDDSVEDIKDLVWTAISAVSDIRVDGTDYDVNGLVPGESVPVTVELCNAGDHLVESVDVYINGSYSHTEAINLPVGQTADIVINVICPDTLTVMSVLVQEANQTDYRAEDNTWTWKIGYPDVTVQLQCNQLGNVTRVIGVLRNEGIGSTSGKLYFVNLQGDILSEKYFSSIQAGDVLVSSFDFDWDRFDGVSVDVRALFEPDGEELYEFNNRDSIHLNFSGHRMTGNPDMVLPQMLTAVEEEAFAGSRFKSVKLPDGLLSIDARAFKDCVRLEQIEIPASVSFIAEDAFDGVSGFVIFCPAASYAEAYAAEHQITCVTE